MGKGGGNQQTTTNTDPWGPQQPYLKELMSEAQKLYKSPGPQLYSGQFTAGLNPNEREAQGSLLNFARSFAPGVIRQTQDTQRFLTTDALNPETNKYLRSAVTAATRPIGENLAEYILPNIRGGALASGMYGSSRQGIAEGLAGARASREVGDVSSRMYSDAYDSGLRAATTAQALAPQLMEMGLAPSRAIDAVGQQNRSLEQALIDEQIQRYMYGQYLPYQQLAQYQNLIQGNYGAVATNQQRGGSVNPLMGGLGGAAMGASTGALFAGPTGGLSIPVGALIGALAGGFGS